MTDPVVRLRDYLEDDFECLMQIRNDAELQAQLLNAATDQTEQQVHDWIERRTKDPSGVFLIVANADSNRCAGFAQIVSIDSSNKSGRFGIAIHPRFQRQGYGATATDAILDHAQQLGLQRIELEVRADNVTAIDLYRRIGFETTSTGSVQLGANERPIDTINMALSLKVIS
jgi:RimJ/RimL family protein N-acetyltransferase